MNALRVREFSIVLAWVILPLLAGCTHEMLDVPDHSAMVGVVEVNQVYRLDNQTGIQVLDKQDERPAIDLWYISGTLPPGDAFQRIPFPIEAPDADTTGYNSANLPRQTPVAISGVEIYPNCHVYIGRIAGGDLTNVHLLLVIPNGSTRLPTVAELQEQDKAYLLPIGGPSTTRS